MKNKLNTVDIKGKAYVLVNDRLKYFRENFKDWRLVSDVVDLNEKRIVIKANIINPKGDIVATGLACEIAGSSFINKNSHVENCETSAWGRALANFGIGIDSSVASADEVANAIMNQNKNKLSLITSELNEEAKQDIDVKKTKQFNEYNTELHACEDYDSLVAFWGTIRNKIRYLGNDRKNFLVDEYTRLKEQFNNN